MIQTKKLSASGILAAMLFCNPGWAESTDPKSAAEGQAATSATQVHGWRERLRRLEAVVAAMELTINEQHARIETLESGLTAVQANSVLDLDGKLILGVDANGYTTAFLTGINVQIDNGTGSTISTNGLGNLTIGYNEAIPDVQLSFCSDGALQSQSECLDAGGTWASNQRVGSHNLVLGFANAYSQYGGLLAGVYNIVNGPFASVSGGFYNTASGPHASISGGTGNLANGNASAVSGGARNVSHADESSISGGSGNVTEAIWSSISGGLENSATAAWGAVSGGFQNVAAGNYSSVSGGQLNSSNGAGSSVSGGLRNSAASRYSSVSGGNERVAPYERNWAAGSLLEDH